VCRKGLKIPYYQHNPDRLKQPLKRVNGCLVPVSWDEALDGIAGKLKEIVDRHGPKSLAYMGGGGQGCHFEAAFGVSLLRGMGSRYHYNALAQELTGHFWVGGRCLGKQYMGTIPHDHDTDLLMAIGWNGWMSHQMPQARRHLARIAKDPDKLLVVIDPRKSETARKADIHLPIRVGTDALFTRAMIAIILQEGWENRAYIEQHVSGLDEIRDLFAGFDARAALKVCELDYEAVRDVAQLFATRRSSLHSDLGILLNRHSTVTSYLETVLLAVCGRIGVAGGNVIPGTIMPLGSHSDERNPRTWRTVATDFPAIMGYFPPNVMPEEILSGKEERLRAVIASGSNPLRSYADTSAYEEAFAKLDLLVTVDVVPSETAVLSHYVLPAASAYEKWDGTFFPWTWPEVFFQMRRPMVAPEGECLEEGEIFTRIAERMGLLPEIPESLIQAAAGDRAAFGVELMGFLGENPGAMKFVPMVLTQTLGRTLGSAHLAALWGLLQVAPQEFRDNAERAGFSPGPLMGEEVFQAVLDRPEGLWVGRCDPEKNLASLQTEDKRVQVHIPELSDWVKSIQPESEEKDLAQDPAFPLLLMAGRHFDYNANTIMRDPAWNEGRDRCSVLMHPEDAGALGLTDGKTVKVTTEAGEEELPVEITETARQGHVIIPHGFGLSCRGTVHGANVNRLTKNPHRDRLAATPLHRYVPCRVEAVG
jgi:anaerobic selenocysteine-containing dehydrogenase